MEPFVKKYMWLVQGVAFGIVLAYGLVSLYSLGNDALGTALRTLNTTQGGTGTSTQPTDLQLLVGQNSGVYGVRTLTAGVGITLSTSTTALTITSSAGTVYLATTSPWTVGQLAYVASDSAVTSVATGTLTETVTGLEFDATRSLVGGAAVLSLSTGYVIPLSASTTNWNAFYDAPSSVITAGTNLTWSANTLNVDDPFAATDFTATRATTTNATSTNLFATLGRFTTLYGLTSLFVPNGSDPTVDTTGMFAINTSTSSLRFYDGTAERQIKPEWSWGATFASSSLAYDGGYATGGTTTVSRSGFKYGVTNTEYYCRTNVGNVTIVVGDGTASSSPLRCTASGATDSTASNGAFIARELILISVGSADGNASTSEIYFDATARWTTD